MFLRNKKISFFAAFLIFSTITGNVYADSLNLSFSFLNFDYREYDFNGNEIDGDTSNLLDMKGFKINYEQNLKYFYLIYNLEYQKGKTKYKGGTWEGDSLEGTMNNVYLINSSINFKVPFFKPVFSDKYYYESDNNFQISFLGGLGYRYWNRGKMEEIEGDYNEIYKWPYFDAGIEFSIDYEYWSAAIGFKYQKAISPKMIAELQKDETFNLGNTFGYNIYIPLKLKLGNNWGLLTEFVYDYWNITHSNSKEVTFNDGTAVSAYEPDSKTENKYLNVGFYIDF